MDTGFIDGYPISSGNRRMCPSDATFGDTMQSDFNMELSQRMQRLRSDIIQRLWEQHTKLYLIRSGDILSMEFQSDRIGHILLQHNKWGAGKHPRI